MRWRNRIKGQQMARRRAWDLIVWTLLGLAPLFVGLPSAEPADHPTPLAPTAIPLVLSVETTAQKLAKLTGWNLKGWPFPSLRWTTPEELAPFTGRFVRGSYDAQGNTIWLTPACYEEELLASPALHCEAVLLHELVHWVQYHQTGQAFATEANEAEATYWKERFIAQEVGYDADELRQPEGPAYTEWPSGLLQYLTGMVLKSSRMNRVLTKDDDGALHILYLRQVIWEKGSWRYAAQFWYHRGHPVLVELFNTHESPPALLTAWADENYATARIFHGRGKPTGRWVEVEKDEQGWHPKEIAK